MRSAAEKVGAYRLAAAVGSLQEASILWQLVPRSHIASDHQKLSYTVPDQDNGYVATWSFRYQPSGLKALSEMLSTAETIVRISLDTEGLASVETWSFDRDYDDGIAGMHEQYPVIEAPDAKLMSRSTAIGYINNAADHLRAHPGDARPSELATTAESAS